MAVTISLALSSKNNSNNTATVTAVLTAKSTYGSYNLMNPPGSITIDGTTYSFRHSFNKNTTTTLATKSKDVKLNSNGSKTVKVSATFKTGVSSGTVSTAKSITLGKATGSASSAKTTKPPSGIKFTRSGDTIEVTWKLGETYSKGQKFKYCLNGKKKEEKTLSVGASDTSKSFTVPFSSYNDTNQLESIIVYISGQATGKNSSGWASATYTVAFPPNPELTAELLEEAKNQSKFSWTIEPNTTSNDIFNYIELQTATVNNSAAEPSEWSAIIPGLDKNTSTGNSSVTITEDSDISENADREKSLTRWFRARSVGPRGGNPTWVKEKHVYSWPYQAVITSSSCTDNQSGGYLVSVQWVVDQPDHHPIDKAEAEYAFITPGEGMSYPDNGSTSWTAAGKIKDTDEADRITFELDSHLEDDQCLFVRINTTHDTNTTHGVPTLIKEGKLPTPEIGEITTSPENHTVQISATNNSKVPDSEIVVLYCPASHPGQPTIVGRMQGAGSQSKSFQCPDWTDETSIAFSLYAVVMKDGKERMASEKTDWSNGSVLLSPNNVTAVQDADNANTIRVEWDWVWDENYKADEAVISWSSRKDAWMSTQQPSTYTVSSLYPSKWNIVDLEAGVTWYVRVKLGVGTGENIIYSPWSDITEANTVRLSSAPATPLLVVSPEIVTYDGEFTATWAYSSTDGTAQMGAVICEAAIAEDGSITYGDVIRNIGNGTHITMSPKDIDGWAAGNTYQLCIKVTSASGRSSDSWSKPVAVTVAEAPKVSIESTSLESSATTVYSQEDVDAETFAEDPTLYYTYDAGTEAYTQVDAAASYSEDTEYYSKQNITVNVLTKLPLSVKVTGAGETGTTSVIVERAESYYLTRPDEDYFIGYAGETIFIATQTGEDEIILDREEILSRLDDGCSYRIIAMVTDNLGQSAISNPVIFTVMWEHQALIPAATVCVNSEEHNAFITIENLEGVSPGDHCEIYRLSADKPELIVANAEFGETYVDPYPALGEFGGHRIVFVSAYDDYITADNRLAWIDTREDEGDAVEYYGTIIDFNNQQAIVKFNMDFSNSWDKDFQETKYLGGSIQGDWNLGISRTGSVSATALIEEDPDTISTLRDLAAWPGICHVRTPDGSSYSANVTVSENRSYKTTHSISEFDFNITRVDAEALDGMSLEEWEADHGLE